MDVVVVESPAKAKTINRYLGSGYKVLASYGHVRDLPAKDGSVRPDSDFAMTWQIDARAEKHLKEIAEAVKNADHLYLATDPDREGEAISWHVQEVLKARRALDNVDVKRVAFHEITKDAVLEALAHPRPLNRELIEAYLARRALDYLVGFTLSPVLWRKLPGSRSAGRVQSVALRLICEREAEIEAFKPREYWTVEGTFRTPKGESFAARLVRLDGEKLDKFDLGDEAAAKKALAAATGAEGGAAQLPAGYVVERIERRKTKRHPQPPFTTSTLQQEASRKLGFGATRTMRTAQRLYEGVDIGSGAVGLITYMRTDSVTLSREAIGACRQLIESRYGRDYLPAKPRVHRTTAKNAQEAHEAIRPTDISRRPEDLAHVLDRDQLRLYELIWRRTVASQMESAVMDQVAVDLAGPMPERRATFRATGSVVVFDGFLTLYQEGRDDPGEEDERNRRLPALSESDIVSLAEARPEQHFTQPPPRYTEASLVKRLEELGIGRPSTYAQIIQVLQDREYVRLEKRRFVPEDRGRLVTAFLTSFFRRYVQYNFTAELENQLDEISNGERDWKSVLREFWEAFSKAVEETSGLTIKDVLEALNEELGPHFFPATEPGKDPRACPSCGEGRLSLKLGKYGAFIGCSNYPECRYTRPLTAGTDEDAAENGANGERELGTDPETGGVVSLRKGPYGHYIQLAVEGEEKPKRVSLPRGMDPASIDLDRALQLLSLPREIGIHPATGQPIVAGIGRYGPYVKEGSIYASLSSVDDVLTIGLNRAVDLLEKSRSRKAPLRELGTHPEDGSQINIVKGRYGPYIKGNGVNAPLPKGRSAEDITLEEAVELLKARQGRAKGRRGAKTDKKNAKSAKTDKTAKTSTSAKSPGTRKAGSRKTAAGSGTRAARR